MIIFSVSVCVYLFDLTDMNIIKIQETLQALARVEALYVRWFVSYRRNIFHNLILILFLFVYSLYINFSHDNFLTLLQVVFIMYVSVSPGSERNKETLVTWSN